MDIKEWNGLSQAEQDGLASQYGLNRSGEKNELATEEELTKIPIEKKVKKVVEPKQDEKPKKEDSKSVVKETPKRSNKRRTSSKPKSRKRK